MGLTPALARSIIQNFRVPPLNLVVRNTATPSRPSRSQRPSDTLFHMLFLLTRFLEHFHDMFHAYAFGRFRQPKQHLWGRAQ